MARNFVAASTQKLESAVVVLSGPPLTFSCWARPNDVTNAQALLGITKGSGGTPPAYFLLWLRGDLANDPVYFTSLYNTGASASINGYVANSWQHIAGVSSGVDSRYVYLNGVKSTQEITSVSVSGLNTTLIGAYKQYNGNYGNYTNGMIAHAAIWNVALSDTEIIALAQGVSPLRIRPAALVGYWPLAGVGAVELDAVGKNNMLVVGATAVGDPPMIRSIIRKRRFYSLPGGSAWTKSLTDAFGLTDGLARGAGKVLADSFGLTDALARGIGKALAEAFVLTDTRIIAAARVIVQAFGLTDGLAKGAGKTLTESVIITDTMLRDAMKTLSEVVSILDTRTLAIAKVIGESFGITDSVTAMMALIVTTVSAYGDQVTVTGYGDGVTKTGYGDQVTKTGGKA